jgi:hypothetical protein
LLLPNIRRRSSFLLPAECAREAEKEKRKIFINFARVPRQKSIIELVKI